MTRINVGIPPKDLSNRHLMAEHREIKRVPNNVIKRLKALKQINLGPQHFTLGTGHVLFFNDKLYYLHKRYVELREECIKRSIRVTDYEQAFLSVNSWAPHLYNDWRPRKVDYEIILERLQERDAIHYKYLSPYRLWKASLADAVETMKATDPELFNHIKTIKK